MIEAVNLTKGFQNQVVVRGLNLRVAPGEIVGLLGAAGSGKSTAIDLFLNLLKPTSGVSKLGGFDATLQPVETKKRVGYVPAGMPLYEQLTGAENVRYLGSLAGFDDLSEETIRDLFRELGLDAARAAERAGGYDAATRIRVGLGVALARNAKEFLLDDPTRGLGEGEAQEFLKVVRRLASGSISGEAAPVLWATQDGELAAHFDRVGLMAKGKPISWVDVGEMSGSEFAEACRRHVGAA